MHPLVRDLYKRVLLVGRDYPLGLDHVRTQWKKALRNRNNCPSCYQLHDSLMKVNPTKQEEESASMSPSPRLPIATTNSHLHNENQEYIPCLNSLDCEREIRKAVGKGRHYVREMMALIQFKKYRSMKKRYSHEDDT